MEDEDRPHVLLFPDSPQPMSPMTLPNRKASDHVPDFSHEEVFIARGLTVCGCDEAGRGPLAGPVTAAAIVLNPNHVPSGLHDSKKLTERKREALFDEIIAEHFVSCVSLNAALVDRMNIRAASLHAMALAVEALPVAADHALIDGNAIPPALTGKATALVKGDARCLSIAAASIVAKVTRDRQMVRAHADYPEFGFDGHKGYPSPNHRTLVADLGPCPIHRRTFAPVRSALEARQQAHSNGTK